MSYTFLQGENKAKVLNQSLDKNTAKRSDSTSVNAEKTANKFQKAPAQNVNAKRFQQLTKLLIQDNEIDDKPVKNLWQKKVFGAANPKKEEEGMSKEQKANARRFQQLTKLLIQDNQIDEKFVQNLWHKDAGVTNSKKAKGKTEPKTLMSKKMATCK